MNFHTIDIIQMLIVFLELSSKVLVSIRQACHFQLGQLFKTNLVICLSHTLGYLTFKRLPFQLFMITVKIEKHLVSLGFSSLILLSLKFFNSNSRKAILRPASMGQTW